MKDVFKLTEQEAAEIEACIGPAEAQEFFDALGIQHLPSAENIVKAFAASPKEVEGYFGDTNNADGRNLLDKARRIISRISEGAQAADGILNRKQEDPSAVDVKPSKSGTGIPPIFIFGTVAFVLLIGILVWIKSRK